MTRRAPVIGPCRAVTVPPSARQPIFWSRRQDERRLEPLADGCDLLVCEDAAQRGLRFQCGHADGAAGQVLQHRIDVHTFSANIGSGWDLARFEIVYSAAETLSIR